MFEEHDMKLKLVLIFVITCFFLLHFGFFWSHFNGFREVWGPFWGKNGKVDLRYKKQYNVWIVRDDEKIIALSTVCTHLGCTPNWLETDRKFKCPCHGSGFRSSGINFEGPAPRPLERYRIYLANDGQIIVDKNKNFKYEKGEWNRTESYLTV